MSLYSVSEEKCPAYIVSRNTLTGTFQTAPTPFLIVNENTLTVLRCPNRKYAANITNLTMEDAAQEKSCLETFLCANQTIP